MIDTTKLVVWNSVLKLKKTYSPIGIEGMRCIVVDFPQIITDQHTNGDEIKLYTQVGTPIWDGLNLSVLITYVLDDKKLNELFSLDKITYKDLKKEYEDKDRIINHRGKK